MARLIPSALRRDPLSGLHRPLYPILPAPQRIPPRRGQLADQPVGLERVGEPGCRPAVLEAALDGARADALAVAVEQRQLAARLVEAAGEPGALRDRREDDRFADLGD